MPPSPTLAATALSYSIAVALAVLGCSIGLWFTRTFWMDQASGQARTLFDRVRAGVIFLLTGSVPGAVQAIAVNSEDGVLTMAGFALGAGVGFLLGFFIPPTYGPGDLFARALGLRVRAGGGTPTPEEVFAFATRYTTDQARKMLGLGTPDFVRLFSIGAETLGPKLGALGQRDVAVVLDSLCGVPVSQVARNYGMTPLQVADVLVQVL